MASLIDTFIYGFFVYIALILFVAGLAYRWVRNRFSWTAMSSELMEMRVLGATSVPLHYAIIVLLIVHIGGVATGFGVSSLKLMSLWVAGAVAGIIAIYGAFVALIRRIIFPSVRSMSKAEDYIILILLILILALGLYQYAAVGVGGLYPILARWFKGVFIGSPNIEPLAYLPWWIKLHTFLAMLFVAYWPFTKLAGMISYPITYITRKYQVIRLQRRMYK
ncbi:MAG: respiratory nitrate reductase subunit gamma [Desulfurococcales archaeon]|nr:respiratory nitrate reductase subunit gamma [Desulfurococcales archaeon]